MSEQAGPQTAIRQGSSFRSFVVRHPILSFLVLAHLGLWGCMMPVIFMGAPPVALSAVGALLGLAVPALVVTGVTGGREEVRALLRRTFRWRVRVRWYVVAVLAFPVGSLVLSSLFEGPGVLGAFSEDWAAAASTLLLEMAVALVTVQLFEELGWSGFAQHLVQDRRGALKAALLLSPAFVTVHVPMHFIGGPVNADRAAMVLGVVAISIPLAIFIRVLLAWMYNRTGQSVLLAAILHASFNTSDDFLGRLTASPAANMVPLLVVIVLAVVVAIASRGRLAHHRVVAGQPMAGATQAPVTA